MAYTTRKWRCAAVPCKEPGELSVIALLATPGGRKDRQSKTTGAVRLCRAHGLALANGIMPDCLRRSIDAALQHVTEGQWHTPPAHRK